jgi:undecaprenyl-diphosphatase
MTYFHACVLGLLQGIAEFLPISSSAHLTLAPWLFGWPDPGLTFDVALHLGTLVAILAYFWRDWLEILGGAAANPSSSQGRLLGQLVLATIPGAVAGLIFEKKAEEAFRNPAMIAALLMVFALFMEAADRFGRRGRQLTDFSWTGALFVGCAQALALMPGVSRSGSTLTAALLLGLTREASAKFSFLLATPIIAGAAILKLRHLHGADLTGPFLAGVAVSTLSGLAAVSFFMARIRSTGTKPYTIYRLALGAVVLAIWFRSR